MTNQEPTRAQPPEHEKADLAAACAQLQGQLDALLADGDAEDAVASLDSAVASLREAEQRNVSSIQLVALDWH
jgi:hypothetical protein